MNESEIINVIAHACEDDTLRFQVIIQDSTLHIYINRPTPAELDYQQLKPRISLTIVSLYPAQVEKIWLYCRVLGEIEPDWQSVWSIAPDSSTLDNSLTTTLEEISHTLAATNSVVDKIEQELDTAESFSDDTISQLEELPIAANDEDRFDLTELELEAAFDECDFSQYCFIRNQRLLYAVLDPPPADIARLIDAFERFDKSLVRSQLPILEVYFEKSTAPNLDFLSREVLAWWNEITKLDSDSKRKLAIWLSRYCLNPQQTMEVIDEVLTASTVTTNINHQQLTSAPFNTDDNSFQPSQDKVNKLDPSLPQPKNWFNKLWLAIAELLKIVKAQ